MSQVSILPNIIKVAQEKGIEINQRTLTKREVLCVCPNCGDNFQSGRFKLSLNTMKNSFRCVVCDEKGGVIDFICWIDNKPRTQVIDELREAAGINNPNRKKQKVHPADMLTRKQLQLIGFRPISVKMPKDRSYIKRTKDWIWSEWNEFVNGKKRLAFQILLLGIKQGNYSRAVESIKQMSEETGITDLLSDSFKMYGTENRYRPQWAQDVLPLVDTIHRGLCFEKLVQNQPKNQMSNNEAIAQ